MCRGGDRWAEGGGGGGGEVRLCGRAEVLEGLDAKVR